MTTACDDRYRATAAMCHAHAHEVSRLCKLSVGLRIAAMCQRGLPAVVTLGRMVCDTDVMSDILTIRVPAKEKARWERAAAAVCSTPVRSSRHWHATSRDSDRGPSHCSPSAPALYTCEPVLTEAAHFLGSPVSVLGALAEGLLACPWDLAEHHVRVRELAGKYADQPMDLTDACLVAMSEQWWECKVITVDAADFQVCRRRGRHAIPLLTPASS